MDGHDDKYKVGESDRGDKEAGESRDGEAIVVDEGRAEENAGGDHGAGNWAGVCDGMHGEDRCYEESEDIPRNGEWNDEMEYQNSDNAGAVDIGDGDQDVKDVDSAKDDVLKEGKKHLKKVKK
ncbi:hypothetical protein MTO96_016938 [Rhipicephalus appendiculatus]